MSNVVQNCIKYLIAGCLVWLSLHLSNVRFSFSSCIILCQLAGFLEWSFKVWMVRQLENAVMYAAKWNAERTKKIVNEAMDRE